VCVGPVGPVDDIGPIGPIGPVGPVWYHLVLFGHICHIGSGWYC